MALLAINLKPSRTELRQFAGLWLVAFGLIGAYVWARTDARLGAPILVAISLAVGFPGLLWPSLVRPLFIAWVVAAYPISWVVSHLLLGSIFFAAVTPAGLIMRLMRHDPMERSFDRSA